MWTSLFGELGILKGRSRGTVWQPTRSQDARGQFAVTAVLEGPANPQGSGAERQVRDMIVSGSAAQAMRSHFAGRDDPDGTSHAVALHDPMAACAPAIVRMLSEGGGEPVERVQLRERATLRSLATIERTRVVLHPDESLKVYHADVPLDDPESAEIPLVLMERAELAAVIVGSMHPESVALMLDMLQHACLQPTWRCPRLLFLLPPSAADIANRISSLDWPEALHVTVRQMITDAALPAWNEVLDVWRRSRSTARWAGTELPVVPAFDAPAGVAGRAGANGAEGRLAGMATPGAWPTPAPGAQPGAASSAVPHASPSVLPVASPADDALRASAAGTFLMLRSLMEHDGLLACAVCDAASGRVLGREMRDAHLVDIDVAALACAQALRSQRLSARSMGLGETLSEVSVIAGSRQQIVRMLRRQPGLFIFVLLDLNRANVSLVRYRLIEFDKSPRAA